MTRLAVLMTCHERRDTTLACLDRLHRQTGHDAVVEVHLTDAGSRDGTAAAVRSRFPATNVVEAGPELFWNGGMRSSWAAARATAPDAYLWLNDDTMLDPDALARLLRIHLGHPTAIVVGATRDPDTGAVTYSGVRRPDRRRPLAFDRVAPGAEPRPVETMNGNCVLIPAAVDDRVGGLDGTFTHGMGDYDYGLRARRRGVPVLLAPGTIGTCRANEATVAGSVTEQLSRLRGPKLLPPREWRAFARRWAGPLWPVYFASPYLRGAVAAFRRDR